MRSTPMLRKIVLLGTPFAAMLACGAAALALQAELPSEVPSHWGAGGLSDDTMPLQLYVGLFAVLAGGIGLGLQSLRHRIAEPTTQRLVGGIGVGMAVWLAGICIGTLLAARGTTGPIPFPTSTFVVASLLGVAATALAAGVVRPLVRAHEPIDAVRLEVAPGEAVVWTGGASAPPWVWGLLATALVPLPIVAGVGLWWVVGLLVAVLAIGVSVLRVRVAVGPQGLVARTGPFGVIRYRVPLRDVVEVHAEQVEPLAYGGWGLRLLPGIRGLVVRSGPGLRVEQQDGPTIVVTVDDADVAAGVLLAHRAGQA